METTLTTVDRPKPFCYYNCTGDEMGLEGGSGSLNPNRAMSITAVPKFREHSFEELRVNDYQHLDREASKKQKPPVHCEKANKASDVGSAHRAPGIVSLPFVHDPWLKTGTTRTLRVPAKPNVYGSCIVTLRVGTEVTRDFIVHEQLLIANSAFMAASMKAGWKENNEKLIPLPEDQPDIFEIYQIWLYERVIRLPSLPKAATDAFELGLLVDTYIFGNKMLDLLFTDAIFDCIIEHIRTKGIFDINLIGKVYTQTLPDSPLRRLLRDLYACAGTREWLDQLPADLGVQVEFMKDLLKDQLAMRLKNASKSPPFLGDTCVYHEHGNGSCYKVSMLSVTWSQIVY